MLARIVLLLLVALVVPSHVQAAERPGKPVTERLAVAAVQAYSCEGARKYCKQIKSCAEACFYLTKCGAGRLDRDKDGISCENVCQRRCGKR